jgi:hypothetical protein
MKSTKSMNPLFAKTGWPEFSLIIMLPAMTTGTFFVMLPKGAVTDSLTMVPSGMVYAASMNMSSNNL